MPSLRELQQDFAAGLRGAGSSLASQLAPGGLPAEERIAIYRHAVQERYVEALSQSFPRVQAALGERLFRGAVLAYVDVQWQWQPEISRFGADFPCFLRHSADERCPVWLADLAELEALVRRIAELEPLLNPDPAALAALSSVPAACLRFTPSPSVAWLSSNFPLLDIWQLGAEPALLQALAPPCCPGAVLVVHEADHSVSLRPIRLAEAAWLTTLAENAGDIEPAVEHALHVDPGFDLSTTLGAALTRGEVVVGFVDYP